MAQAKAGIPREYLNWGIRRDSVAQPVKNSRYAELICEIAERMTGEAHIIEQRRPNCICILRLVNEERWVRA